VASPAAPTAEECSGSGGCSGAHSGSGSASGSHLNPDSLGGAGSLLFPFIAFKALRWKAMLPGGLPLICSYFSICSRICQIPPQAQGAGGRSPCCALGKIR